jgi:hypothetical protein
MNKKLERSLIGEDDEEIALRRLGVRASRSQ